MPASGAAVLPAVDFSPTQQASRALWSAPSFLIPRESDGDEPSEAVHLPANVLRSISNYVVQGETPGSVLINLLSMCGVCSEWRAVARELNPGTALGFDGLDNAFPSQPSIQRFRRLSAAAKEEVFLAAARLFTGYSEVSFSGDGVSDRLLSEVAARAGPALVKVKIHSASQVTDQGLCALVTKSPKLQFLVVEDISKTANTGKFLVHLFEDCQHLEHLHVVGVPNLSWQLCRSSSQNWVDTPLTKFTVRSANLDTEFGLIVGKLGRLCELELDGPARNIKSAALSCLSLHRVSYQVSCKAHLDEALAALMNMRDLQQLELIIKNFVLTADQLRVIGMLPVTDLRMDSFIYKQQPTLSRSSYSHVDNEGVKALVDSICTRWCSLPNDMRPMKLSLCGATALTHDAVSALLRLPILTELDIGGCCRITAMDKMRLVAKVRAGREMLDSGRKPGRSSRFPGLII